jgi:hypothetical protein
VEAVRIAASLLCPALTLITICYTAICAAKPFRTCRRCDGRGRHGRGLRSRPCRRCDGAGIRIRFGRHLFNELTRRLDASDHQR